MSTIKINDHLGVEVLSGTAAPGSGIAKYLKGNAAAFVASGALALEFAKPLRKVNAGPLGLGLSFGSSGSFGTTGVDWKFQAGANLSLTTTAEGAPVPSDVFFGNPFQTPAGKTFLGISFAPTLSAGLSTSMGDLQFGFSAGGSVNFTSGRSFPNSPSPSLSSALQSLLETAVVPANALDVRQMKEGDYGSVSGQGQFGFSASVNLAQAFNPLALPQVPLKQVGKISLEAGVSLEVGAKVQVSGQYQVRVVKLDGQKARVGLYKMSGSQFQFDVEASAGLGLNVGKTEMLAKALGMLGAPKADIEALIAAGLSDAQAETLKKAVEASVNRSISVSLAGSFAASLESSKVLEYEFDLDLLGTEGVDALNRALQADWSPLTARDSSTLPQGIKMLSSEVEEVRKKSVVWKVNLLGIVNHRKVTELIRSGMVMFNAETGELVVTDSVTARKIAVTTFPLAADPQRLHKLLLQSLLITAAYHASDMQLLAGSLSGSMNYFEQVSNGNTATVGNFLDNFTGLGLMTEADRAAFLAGGTFRGRASVFLDAMFDSKCMDAMFFTGGKPRKEEDFDTIGRKCIAALVREGDEGDYRRIPAVDDALWKSMSAAGQATIPSVLPASLKDSVKLQVILHDYSVIKWWSQAMSKAAKEVSAMKKFLAENGKPAEKLADDKGFKKRRDALNDALEDVASDSMPDFLDAWGILVLDSASGRKSKLRGILITAAGVVAKDRA